MAVPIPPISFQQESKSSADAKFTIEPRTGSFFGTAEETGLYNAPNNLVGGTLIKTNGVSSIALYAAVAIFAIAVVRKK